MASDWCTVSAPASARFMGEHAVLRGGPAIAFALTPRIIIHAKKTSSDIVSICSKFGLESFPLSSRNIEGDHRFIKAALLICQEYLPHGIEIKVDSDIDHTTGLGTSAAVTVATIGAILKLTTKTIDLEEVLRRAQKTIRVIQGEGSGVDAAASTYGGVICFHANECRVEKLVDSLPLFLAYSGMKTPTSEVIAFIKKRELEEPARTARIFDSINSITYQAKEAILAQDLSLLGKLMNQAHIEMQKLGLENKSLSMLKTKFAHDTHVLGVKISGSGLGDCLVVLANRLSKESKKLCLPIQPSARGLEDE